VQKIDLFSGDCLSVMPKLAEHSIDLVFCDLPYGTTDSSWDVVIPFEKLWPELKRLLKPNGVCLFTASQPFTSLLVCSNLDWYESEWIFEKNAGSNFGNVKQQPMKEHESVLVFAEDPNPLPYMTIDHETIQVFSPSRHTYNPIMQERAETGKARVKTPVTYNTKTGVYCGGLDNKVTVTRPDLRVPRSVQKWNRERGLHPNQKPLEMAKYFIQTYSNEGDTILDPTMGCGTFILAAKQLNRSGIGIELDEKYFQTAKERIENDTTG
jgi:site-specific DNA-methyltransferase (adenine-specific)